MDNLYKKWLILFIALVPIKGIGQITAPAGTLLFEDTLDLRPLHEWVTINNSSSGCWEIGTPDKSFFSAAYTNKIALLTDSSETYQNNLNDAFTITLPSSEPYWGEGILSFYHKFDTDTLKDGGMIEVSYNEGDSWENIINDQHNIQTNFIGLYRDTLVTGQYGFSGHSDNWQYVELYWWWNALTKKDLGEATAYPIVRFRFRSDAIDNKREGWMIDDIVFRGYSITGNIDSDLTNKINVYPNPARDKIIFHIENMQHSESTIFLYNDRGHVVKINESKEQTINVSDLNPGIYFYKIFYNTNSISTGKIIIN